LKERGILAAGTARPRKGYQYDQLKGTVLQKRGDVAWPTEKDRKMTALRWKDKKDVFFLSTIYPPPVVPAWLKMMTLVLKQMMREIQLAWYVGE